MYILRPSPLGSIVINQLTKKWHNCIFWAINEKRRNTYIVTVSK